MGVLPIVEGCLAIITHSDRGYAGGEVRVGKFKGSISLSPSTSQWRVYPHFEAHNDHKMCELYCSERYLLRIDGNSEVFESEYQERLSKFHEIEIVR